MRIQEKFLKNIFDKNRFIACFAVFLVLLTGFTACGSKKHELRTGPTVTPAPTLSPEEKASREEAKKEENSLGLSDEEIVNVLKEALERMQGKYQTKLSYKADEEHSELKKYDDGSSDVIVTDDHGNETARLMYNEKHELVRAVFNDYKEGKLVSGAVYLGGELNSYFENKEGNGVFHLEIEIKEDERVCKVAVSKGKTKNYVFDAEGKHIRTEDNKN